MRITIETMGVKTTLELTCDSTEAELELIAKIQELVNDYA